MARIVLTHGRGLRARDKEKLQRKFVRHMRDGLGDIGYTGLDNHDVSFIYYGDVLERMDVEPEPRLPSQELAAILDDMAADRTAKAFMFDSDVEDLCEHLTQAGSKDAGICSMMEERASRSPIDAEHADDATRRTAIDAALDAHMSQLLDDPRELHKVLNQRFGPDLDDDDTVQRALQDLDARVGSGPRETASRRVADETGGDDPNRVDKLLRSWIVDPAIDAVAGLRALRMALQTHGVDLRRRLSSWQTEAFKEIRHRVEDTDFGQQWATFFDVIAVIANNSMLDGLYIARWMTDVEDYFRDDTIRNAVRGLFRDVLQNHDEPTVLIAHSLGTVIAYDALREYPDLDVSGLITLGSPLSIGHFRRSLARTGESGDRLPIPRMIDEWINVYSERDPLALGSGIEKYFRGGGRKDGPGPFDRQAENSGYLDAHNPDQYLRSSVTAKAVVSMIAQATVREGYRDR